MTMSAYGLPPIETPDKVKIEKPHPEWVEHNITWRWLLDSYEGGQAYRTAIYGIDTRMQPIRNLRRHKFEYPANDAGSPYASMGPPAYADQATAANDDSYELRRSRTPIPTFVSECINIHLSKIQKREVTRDAPAQITKWWENVDGKGTNLDDYMASVVAPIFLTLGQLDVIVDLPAVPEGETLTSRADEIRLGMDVPVLSYILPENLIWWQLDRLGYYERCLVREIKDDGCSYRYWTKDFWAEYDDDGNMIGQKVEHPYGRVPICRVFYERRARCRNVGRSHYEETADLQREYYNRDSELILSDTLQAHPMVQAPEDYITADGEIKTGPDYVLPKKLMSGGTGQSFYEGWDILDFPKGASDSIRLNKQDIRDAVDRANALTKPAGAAGTGAGTVSQSGISKQMDQAAGNDLLAKIAKALERVEGEISELYYLVAGRGKIDMAALEKTVIEYPTEFDLATPIDMAEFTGRVQLMLQTAGVAPVIEKELFSRLLREGVPGLDDDIYKEMDKELDEVLEKGAEMRDAGGMALPVEGGDVTANPAGRGGQQEGTIDGGQGAGPTAGATEE